MAGSTYTAEILNSDGTQIAKVGEITFLDGTAQPIPNVNSITSGALPTVALVSGTGAQISASTTLSAYIALTSDATNAAATAAVALSPDNVTYSTLATISVAAAINNLGALVQLASVRVPAGWYVKVTVAHMTITSTTYA